MCSEDDKNGRETENQSQEDEWNNGNRFADEGDDDCYVVSSCFRSDE